MGRTRQKDDTPIKTPTGKSRTGSRNATPVKKSRSEPNKEDPEVDKQQLAKYHFCDDSNIQLMKDVTNINLSLKRRRASMKPSLDDVQEGSTEDDDDETREALSVQLQKLYISYVYTYKI
jgi:hypothetical protein